MKFKSIQFSVAALAGAIVLSIVAALVLYAVYSGERTQSLVQERTRQQFENVIEQRLGPWPVRKSARSSAGWKRRC